MNPAWGGLDLLFLRHVGMREIRMEMSLFESSVSVISDAGP